MKKINDIEFEKLINQCDSDNCVISDYEIDLENSINIDLSQKSLNFKNCFFKGARIDLYDFTTNESKDEFQSISFRDCVIENNFYIKDCSLYCVELLNVNISSQQFFIANSNIKRITITGSPDKYNQIASIFIDNIHNNESDLDIRLNDFLDTLIISNSYFKSTTINANSIKRLNIYESEFETSFSFWKNRLLSYSFIDNNTFKDIEAKESDFGSETHFNKTKILGNCNFENVKGNKLKFTKCNFEEYVYFDNSIVNELFFDTAFFKEIVSFQFLNCKSMKFNRTHFDKVAFFNDVEIENLNRCDLKTIRVIKNQLLKTENKIDYLKYNALEQNNLLSNKSLNFNDRTLLELNKKSNDFGNNWTKGVVFTLKKGVMFFSLLIIVNSFITSNYPLSININWNFAPFSQVLTEFLKFVFSLGFDNQEIQSNGFLYLIFIIAKIYIGYGIYQTIAAFKKYGKI